MTGKLYSAEDVASMLGVELDTLYRYARRGELPGLKIGKLWRFAEKDIQEFLQSRQGSRPAEPPNFHELLPHMLRETAVQYRQSAGIRCGGRNWSYSQIDELSSHVSEVLVSCGVEPGERVLLILENSVEFIVACFATWKARAVVVAEDCSIGVLRLRQILKETEPSVIITDQAIAEQIANFGAMLANVKTILLKGSARVPSGLRKLKNQSLESAMREGVTGVVLPNDARPDEVVSISYTSGSTGTPKGVMHTHESWLASAVFTKDHVGVQSEDRMVIGLPLNHAFALRQVLTYILAKASLIICKDVYETLNHLRKDAPTALLLVPAACNVILDHFSSILRACGPAIRYIEIGAGAMGPDRFAQLRDLLPQTALYIAYGLTEARAGYIRPAHEGPLNRVSWYAPGLQVEVQDSLGQPVRAGEVGEIVLKGRGLMKGYWNDPEKSRVRLETHGFRTGDLGRAEDHSEISLLGRIDDMQKIGGLKVNPLEIEAVLDRHSNVDESAVVILPDERQILEGKIHAFVVPKSCAAHPTSGELYEHCRSYLEPYKIPGQFHVRGSLPKSPLGKIQRQELVVELARTVEPMKEVSHARAN